MYLNNCLTETKLESRTIILMTIAMLNYQKPSFSTKTIILSDFCSLCLEIKCLNSTLEFLKIDHTTIKKIDEKDDILLI